MFKGCPVFRGCPRLGGCPNSEISHGRSVSQGFRECSKDLNIKQISLFGKWFSLENDSSSHLENSMCEGVGVDSKYGIG